MFSQTVPPAAATTGAAPMRCFAGKKKVEQARPRGRIVGKDGPRGYYKDLLALPDGRVLVGCRGRYIESPFGLQVRAGPDLAVQAELVGAAGPISIRDGTLLASGPLHGGYQSCIHVVGGRHRFRGGGPRRCQGPRPRLQGGREGGRVAVVPRRGRTLLVCGPEKQFRAWPLLENEAAFGG